MKQNLIMTDCEAEEILAFRQGCENESGLTFEIKSAISNLHHGSALKRLKRYLSYFSFPWTTFLHRNRYNVIIGWQQFHALNFALYCRLFHVKKAPVIIVANFTYKAKSGLVGKLYRRYMSYILKSRYINLVHVPSFKYAAETCREFSLDDSIMAVAPFGTPDNYDNWKNLDCQIKNFVLSIGRSNRDFDWLVKVWRNNVLADHHLLIISDTWHHQSPLPSNVTHLDNVKGEESFPYIAACLMSVVPIDNGVLCSGDTVLLNSMMMKKPVAVTTPSTLAEMYVEDQANGILLTKDTEKAAQSIAKVLNDKALYSQLSESARNSYLLKFSRESLGKNLIVELKRNINIQGLK